jgi:hypothetical protein
MATPNATYLLTRALREKRVSAKSRSAYRSTWERFVSWLAVERPVRVTPVLLEAVVGKQGQEARRAVRDFLDADEDHEQPPIVFDELQAEDFIEWLLTQRKRDGSECGYSTFNNHRAGLFNLFREYKHLMSAFLQSELSTYFRGLKRTIAERAADGAMKIKSGKDPLSFELYSALCEATIAMEEKEAVFARTFLIMTWNLMCRSSNTVMIRHGHIEWRGDALQVYFAHMKNDQLGERPRDPRHIYANPLRPAVCPVLALGIYWASFPFDQHSDQLFPGGSQYDRFRKQLVAVLAREPIASDLRRFGVDPNDVGTHSIRKGAASYCSSGSTSCPQPTAVHLRAGWSLGGVQNTYLRYQAAGDMHVGRTVCGLPQSSELFAILPPQFVVADGTVSEATRATFGDVPQQLQLVAEFALASLVYHYDYIQEKLPSKHVFRQSSLFRSGSLVYELRQRVTCGLEIVGRGLTASGVPPHCSILQKMDRVETAVNGFRDSIVAEVVNGVEQTVGERGVMSRSSIQSAIEQVMERTGFKALVARMNASDEAVEVAEHDKTQPDGSETLLYEWGGRFRRLPHDFSLGDGTVRHFWVQWVCGSASMQLPPLRFVQSSDISNRNTKKRFSDLRFLMAKLETAARAKSLLIKRVSISEALEVYGQIQDAIAIKPNTPCRRVRRQNQLSWRTVVNTLRRQSKE